MTRDKALTLLENLLQATVAITQLTNCGGQGLQTQTAREAKALQALVKGLCRVNEKELTTEELARLQA